ncbi:ATP-binding protein [Nocardia coubleae]|uniref:histidine kinase n=1 Tax=Nocardia coubleae TaxID=356147 RepID=A0A846W2C3_9NOCA|nr:sensor histidine kinase [Nocardia coubleae]NKX86778.1 sensor histidine kinase [Nocardia coubleae]
MRRRLLIVLTVFAALAVLAFAVPLSLTAATSRTQQLVLGRSGDADRFATLADGAGSPDGVRALADEVHRYHELYGENVLVVDARGAPIVNAGVVVTDSRISAALAAARRNQRPQHQDRLTPWSAPVMLVARPVGTGVQVNGAVVIEASTAAARAAIARTWAVIAVGGLGAMIGFMLLALVLSRWVLRPLAAMSDAVAELTATLPKPRGRAPITRNYGGPPEVRALAESVDAMATAVGDSADAQRQLVADTAHAMRNPLAALMIRLDSLEFAVPDTASATFRGATAEVERLTALLDDLLELAVAEAPASFGTAASEEEQCDPAQVVADRIDAWVSAFQEAGVQLAAAPRSAPRVQPLDSSGASGGTSVTASCVSSSQGSGGISSAATHDPMPDDSGAIDSAAAHIPASNDNGAINSATAHLSPLDGAIDSDAARISAPDGGEVTAAISSAALAQILDVALSNSCRYAGAGAHTQVAIEAEQGWVTVRVADDGIGVEPEELAKLTTRFFRGTTAVPGGTGLGLSIAQALARAHGGELAVEAVRPHGLAVAIRLPAVLR